MNMNKGIFCTMLLFFGLATTSSYGAIGYNLDCVVKVGENDSLQMKATKDASRTGLPLYFVETEIDSKKVNMLAEVTGRSIKLTVQNKNTKKQLLTSEGPFVDKLDQDYLLIGTVWGSFVNMNCLVQ